MKVKVVTSFLLDGEHQEEGDTIEVTKEQFEALAPIGRVRAFEEGESADTKASAKASAKKAD